VALSKFYCTYARGGNSADRVYTNMQLQGKRGELAIDENSRVGRLELTILCSLANKLEAPRRL